MEIFKIQLIIEIYNNLKEWEQKIIDKRKNFIIIKVVTFEKKDYNNDFEEYFSKINFHSKEVIPFKKIPKFLNTEFFFGIFWVIKINIMPMNIQYNKLH